MKRLVIVSLVFLSGCATGMYDIQFLERQKVVEEVKENVDVKEEEKYEMVVTKEIKSKTPFNAKWDGDKIDVKKLTPSMLRTIIEGYATKQMNEDD